VRIVVDINHPGQVHYFKNFIRDVRAHGHEVLVTASEKEITFRLLREYGLDFVPLGSYGNTLAKKALNIPRLDLKMYAAVRKFRPDVFLGFGSIKNAHVSRLMRKPAIAFDDTEPSPVEHMLYVPFTDAILTPSCFRKDFGKKHIRYDGYIELAYLHPDYFRPDPAVLDLAGIGKDDPYSVLRFVGWDAANDIGRTGFDLTTKRRAVRELEKYGRVFISSEQPLPADLEPYRLVAPPGQIHHLLHYAQLLVGDSGTMTTEAALLGTPAVRCDSIYAGGEGFGNFAELERRYGLIYNIASPQEALDRALTLISRPGLKREWRTRRDALLKDKIDVNAFMVRFVEQYPESFASCREQGIARCWTGSSS
jgi:predicted glycosyltransferase